MSISIKLSDGIDPKHVSTGTLLTGTVTLALPKQKTITNAKILFTGKIVTEYSEVRVGTAGNTHGPRRHAVERIVLFRHDTVFFPGPFTVPAQTFEWPFEFQVPKCVECERRSTDQSQMHKSLPFVNGRLCNTPPTFEWRDSTTSHVVTARIKYKLVASVDTGSGLFKHSTKQKLPIVVSNVVEYPLLSKALRPTSEVRMDWHDFLGEYDGHRRFISGHTLERPAFRAAVSFPNVMTLAHSDRLATDVQSGSTILKMFQFRISLLPKVRCAAPHGYEFSGYRSRFRVKMANITLHQIVTVRVASTPRLVRNVGTKLIASGGQGYDMNDVIVTRDEVVLPQYSIPSIGVLEEQPQNPSNGLVDIDLTGWAQAVSKVFTKINGRNSANEQPDGKGKRKSVSIRNTPVSGFKSYTVNVQHSVTVEIDLCYDELGNEEHWFLKADIAFMIGGSSDGDIGREELGHSMSNQQDRAQRTYETPSSSGPFKEQEAFQEQMNGSSQSRHGNLDEELPRYEENAEAPPSSLPAPLP